MKTDSTEPRSGCHDCGSDQLRMADGYAQAARVTSDCKPWPAGGTLALCEACGLVQTVTGRDWQTESEQIYAGYTIYHQSGGVEQPIFDQASGVGQARSEAIVQAFASQVSVPSSGRWLDIGCGNGALLRACSKAFPRWSLFGSEVNDKYQSVVESIPGVERLYTDSIERIPGTFDAISLVHVLEHIPGPRAFLQSLAKKLNPGGLLLLEVPDCRKNFFMLVVADHCSHFSVGMLARVAAGAGFEVVGASDTWVPKEITVVARKGSTGTPPERQGVTPELLQESTQVFHGWAELQRILAQARPLTAERGFGIFGTAIAATWLDAETGHKARFFVDEDRNRVGKQHLGKPIIGPSQVPDEATVYVALPPILAGSIAARLRLANPKVRFLTP